MAEHKARTTCNRDCPDTCGIVATLEDGVIVKLEGDPDHPVTKGFLCYRTSRFPELAASSARVAQPMVRRNGRLEPSTWEAALDLITKKLLQVREESGPEAIFHYRSGGSLGILKHMVDLFFDEFGPSRRSWPARPLPTSRSQLMHPVDWYCSATRSRSG